MGWSDGPWPENQRWDLENTSIKKKVIEDFFRVICEARMAVAELEAGAYTHSH